MIFECGRVLRVPFFTDWGRQTPSLCLVPHRHQRKVRKYAFPYIAPCQDRQNGGVS